MRLLIAKAGSSLPISHLAFLSRISRFFYLASRIFISRISHFAFLSRISHFSSRTSHFYLASRIFYLPSLIYYLASRIFISHLAFKFCLAFRNFISHLAFRLSLIAHLPPEICFLVLLVASRMSLTGFRISIVMDSTDGDGDESATKLKV